MFDPIVLIVVNIISEVLFNSLVESFYLSIGLKMKGYRKFTVYSEFRNKYYKEPRSKGRTSIRYKFIW